MVTEGARNKASGSSVRARNEGWRSPALAMELSAEAVQRLDAATRQRWRIANLPAEMQAQFEDDVARGNRAVRLTAVTIPLILFSTMPLWLGLLLDAEHIVGPQTLLLCTLPLSLALLALAAVLMWAPDYRHVEWLFFLVFLYDVLSMEVMRHLAHIDRATFNASITVSIPVAVLVLGRLTVPRSLLFVLAYVAAVLAVGRYFDEPASDRAPSDWLIEIILLSTVLLAAISWRLSVKRIWAATLLLGVLAYRDSLTGLANRRALYEHYQRLSRQAKRDGVASLYLAQLDLDHFKKLNDGYGHEHGDRVLAQVGVLLSEAARRPLDMAARVGGEEFALLFYDCNAEHGARRVEKLLQALRDCRIEHRGNPAGVVTCSAGGVVVTPEAPLDEALRRADGGLYQAKQQGRDRAVFV